MSRFGTCNPHYFLLTVKLIFFSFETPQDQVVDGEALKCMNEDTLKTIVPPAGVRAKLLNRIKKLNDEESRHLSTSGAAAIEVLDEDEPRGETSDTTAKR